MKPVNNPNYHGDMIFDTKIGYEEYSRVTE